MTSTAPAIAAVPAAVWWSRTLRCTVPNVGRGCLKRREQRGRLDEHFPKAGAVHLRRNGADARPRAAVCFTTSAMTRRAADWLARLGGCRPLGILSDHGEDVIWQCEAENVDLLLLETDFSPAAEDTKDVSARCDIAIEVRRRLPECKVYLACEDGCLEKLPALDKAVELALIDGYCVGSITPQQMRTWLNEAAEAMHRRESRRDWTCRQDVLSDE